MPHGGAPRVALIGARAARQGLGPWVARHLAAAGAEVVAHYGTTAATARAAADLLAQRFGLDSRPCTSPEQLLAEGRPDALAILAPAEHHERWLRFALAHDLPVLCEKPLVWGSPDPVATAVELVGAFRSAGLVLMENCQWPETVPAYDALFPGARPAAPRSFFMRLSPARTGRSMLGDALPHPLSLLQAVAPARTDQPVEAITLSTRAAQAHELEVGFRWTAETGPVQVRVELAMGTEQPRIAAWGVDDAVARRYIRTSDYTQFLATGARLVDLPDPLGRLVQRFVSVLIRDDGEDQEAEARRMVQRMRALGRLLAAWDEPSAEAEPT